MFQQVFGKLKSSAFGFALNRNLECPACHNKVLPIVQKDQSGEIQEVRCPACHDSSSTEVWFSQRSDRRNPLSVQPEKCGIRHEFSQGEHRWIIPGSRRPNFFWFFALFWNGITWTISSALIYAFLFGTPTQDVQENPWLKWAVPIFMIPFIVIGLVTLYFAMASSFQKTTICLDLRELTIIKNLFGWKRVKVLPRNAIKDVSLEASHTSDDQRVYGLQLTTNHAKPINVSLSRAHDEKRWLLYELLQALKIDHSPTHQQSHHSAKEAATSYSAYQSKHLNITPRLDGFTYTSTSSISTLLMIMGVGFFIMSNIFCFLVYKNEVPRFPFVLFLPVFMVSGLSMFIYGNILKKTTQVFELIGDKASVVKLRSGKTISEKQFQRSDFSEVEMKTSGEVNNQPRYAVSLKGKKLLKLCSFMPMTEAEALQSRAQLWLNSGS